MAVSAAESKVMGYQNTQKQPLIWLLSIERQRGQQPRLINKDLSELSHVILLEKFHYWFQIRIISYNLFSNLDIATYKPSFLSLCLKLFQRCKHEDIFISSKLSQYTPEKSFHPLPSSCSLLWCLLLETVMWCQLYCGSQTFTLFLIDKDLSEYQKSHDLQCAL